MLQTQTFYDVWFFLINISLSHPAQKDILLTKKTPQKGMHLKEEGRNGMKNALYEDCLPIIHHWVKEESRIQQEKNGTI